MPMVIGSIVLCIVIILALVIYFVYPHIKREMQATNARLHLLNSGQLQVPDDIRADLEEGIQNTTTMLRSIPNSPPMP